MMIIEEALDATRAEVNEWFFENYLPRWVRGAQGQEDPEFIHQFWGTPMHVNAVGQSFWCLDDAAVRDFLELHYAPLRESGYSHTVVADRQVRIYSSIGASVEVIWSRRKSDDVEIERFAAHFEIAKGDEGWRVVGLQGAGTSKGSLDEVWPRMPSEG